MKPIVGAALGIALVACGGSATERPPEGPAEVSFEQLVEDPGRWTGSEISVESGYLASFEVSVLTSGFAESYPPQPTQPQVWVEGAAPTGPCVEEARGTTWAEAVVATGTFTYRADGGLGHLGTYDMALEDATLACA